MPAARSWWLRWAPPKKRSHMGPCFSGAASLKARPAASSTSQSSATPARAAAYARARAHPVARPS
eukprot:2612349-Alexandrium_andersonii.AAC.1